MSRLTMQLEEFTPEFVLELRPVLSENYKETAPIDGEPLDVNYPRYIVAQKVGLLHLYTVRELGFLAGYAIFFVEYHVHHQTLKVADNDVIYISPKHRRGAAGIRLIRFCENHLKSSGVERIIMHTNNKRNISKLLHRLDYEPLETVFSKGL